MRILFDQGTPRGLAHYLGEHKVEFCRDLGWSELANGQLLQAAEDAGFDAGFDALITTDKNLPHQQNMSGKRLAVLILSNAQWPVLERNAHLVQSALTRITSGAIVVAQIPV